MDTRTQVLGMAAVALLAAGLAGCESMGTAAQSRKVQGSVLGSLLGAGTGAIIGNQTGHSGAGTAVGAGLGALGGLLVGNAMDEQAGTHQAPFPVAQAKTKFCPVGGELYSADVTYCPLHGVELRQRQ